MMTPRSVAIASSPGRAEKLPAPPGLSRLFIRKSRTRAGVRANSMFGVRSRSVGPTGRTNGTEGEEPSSPKVTCIGQVRIKAGKKNKKKKPKSNTVVKCRCLQRALFCHTFSEKNKKKKKEMMPRRFWPCWGMPSCHKRSSCSKRKEIVKEDDRGIALRLGLGCSRQNGIRSEVTRQKDELEPVRLSNFSMEQGRLSNYNEEPARTSNYARRSITGREEISDQEEEQEEEEKEGEDMKVYVSSATTTPPKNALLLMRCRSAPQHHSRFGQSPVTTIDEAMEEARVKEVDKGIMGVIMEKKEMEEEEKQVENRKGSTEGEEEDEEEEEEEMRCSSARPLVLARCKSEPASKGEVMMVPVGPDMASTSCFWAHTGSGSRQRKMVHGIGYEQRTPSPLPFL